MSDFNELGFSGTLRPSQQDAIEIVDAQLRAGERRLHIVAPPGSGKTVLGLYIWAEMVRKPVLVLSPNSAIQAQWAARLDLFSPECSALSSTDPKSPDAFTSLTYQSVTLPRRGDDDLDASARLLWEARLIEKGESEGPAEARAWIDAMCQNNPDYYETRLGAYRKDVRDDLAKGGDALQTLHSSSLATLMRLKEQEVGLIILDECHHLMGHWGRVLAEAAELLGDPLILGLTATPPDDKGRDADDVARYHAFFGTVDYEVPVPALVKEGFLAPYQDLVYFVRPTDPELRFIARADHEFEHVVADLCRAHTEDAGTIENLPDWIYKVLDTKQLASSSVSSFQAFSRRDPAFADMARVFLISLNRELPPDVPPPPADLLGAGVPVISMWVPVLDRYVRHGLRLSPDPRDHQRAADVVSRLRMLGMQITETGCQPCASPVSRVMAYARAKVDALCEILGAELDALGPKIRAVVVSDFEKTSAIRDDVDDLLDEEAGGAVAAFRALLVDARTDGLDPVLVTGSTVLVDDDLTPRLVLEAERWLTAGGHEVVLNAVSRGGFHELRGKGRDWCPRVYVGLITELFQRGLTRCLVGTRGLLGEGWDANKINVLVDLTTVTTSMSVNQLRGRSIRLDPSEPTKLANNWDVICIAGEFTKGLDDYRRFIAKHETLFGVCDDSAVEKGVGHVHAAFTDIQPEGVEESLQLFNADMLARCGQRDVARERWRIGEPFVASPVRAVEVGGGGGGGGFPPFDGMSDPWTDASLTVAISQAILRTLHELKLVAPSATLKNGVRAGDYVRLYLKNASTEDSEVFTRSVREALGPLHRPRYVIMRVVDELQETVLSRFLPELLAKFFRKRRQKRAMLHMVPTIFASKKEIVAVYQHFWNQCVSPGAALYAHRGEGEDLVEEMRAAGLTPHAHVHEKDVFV